MNDIPTPESDEVFGPKVDGIRARKCRDLERRLILARSALSKIISTSTSIENAEDMAAIALNITAPKP